MYLFVCDKGTCKNWVELPPRKGDLPPFTPTCSNHEAHHHNRCELMKLKEIKTTKRKKV